MASAVNARGTEFKSSAHQTTGTVLEDCKHHAGVWGGWVGGRWGQASPRQELAGHPAYLSDKLQARESNPTYLPLFILHLHLEVL